MLHASSLGGFVRQRQILAALPISRSTLWRWVRSGRFPQPVKLSPGVTVWRAEEVLQHINQGGIEQ